MPRQFTPGHGEFSLEERDAHGQSLLLRLGEDEQRKNSFQA